MFASAMWPRHIHVYICCTVLALRVDSTMAGGGSRTWDGVDNLVTSLMSGYNKWHRPVDDQTEAVNVYINFVISSIQVHWIWLFISYDLFCSCLNHILQFRDVAKAGFTLRRLDRRLDIRPAPPVKVA